MLSQRTFCPETTAISRDLLVHEMPVFSCVETLVDGTAVKLFQEFMPRSTALRRNSNLPSRVFIVEQGMITFQHSLTGDIYKKPNIFYSTEAHSVIAPCDESIGTTAVLRRAATSSADEIGGSFARAGGYAVFNPQLVVPPAMHIVDVAKLPVLSKPKV